MASGRVAWMDVGGEIEEGRRCHQLGETTEGGGESEREGEGERKNKGLARGLMFCKGV